MLKLILWFWRLVACLSLGKPRYSPVSVCLCTICGRQSGTQIGFFPKYFSFLVIILHVLHTHTFINVRPYKILTVACIVKNIRSCSPNNTLSHPRILDCAPPYLLTRYFLNFAICQGVLCIYMQQDTQNRMIKYAYEIEIVSFSVAYVAVMFIISPFFQTWC
jgi:hypothetical protein